MSRGQRYELRGRVISVDKNHNQVVIAHESIPGLMDAMTMPFTLRADWAYDTMAAQGKDIAATAGRLAGESAKPLQSAITQHRAD